MFDMRKIDNIQSLSKHHPLNKIYELLLLFISHYR